MQWPGLVGPSSQVQGTVADCERTVNLYVEPPDVSSGRPALYPIPGQRAFITVDTRGVRSLAGMNGRAFSVVQNTFYEVFANASKLAYGTVTNDGLLSQIAFNGISGNQCAIAAGRNLYVFNLGTNAFSGPHLTDEAVQIGMLDGYGLAFNNTNGELRLSDLNDFTTWDPTMFALRSNAPDNWLAMHVNAPDIWLIGEQSGDVWFDAGASPFPLAPRTNASFPFGIAANFSIVTAGDSVLWLSRNAQGAGVVVRARGYNPQPVNSYALDHAMVGYQRDSTIADAEAMSFQWSGHTFYVLRFPTANATWAYDLKTGLWVELGKWNSAANRFDEWGPRCITYAFGRHLVGDASDGAITTLDETAGTEADGTAIRRVRVPPALIAEDGERVFIDRFELQIDHGLGTSTGQGQNPVAMIRWSKDFGRTWSSERIAALGAQGEYDVRTFWTRCGSGVTAMVPEIVISDPIPPRIVGALVDARGARSGGRAA